MAYLYIALGAIAGAPLRYFLQGRVQDATGSTFPFGTFVVNVTGCVLIGFISALAEERQLLSRETRILLIIGFLGSYTTFSSFGLDTYNLLRDSEIFRAVAYALLSTLVGLLGVYVGVVLARVF